MEASGAASLVQCRQPDGVGGDDLQQQCHQLERGGGFPSRLLRSWLWGSAGVDFSSQTTHYICRCSRLFVGFNFLIVYDLLVEIIKKLQYILHDKWINRKIILLSSILQYCWNSATLRKGYRSVISSLPKAVDRFYFIFNGLRYHWWHKTLVPLLWKEQKRTAISDIP